MLDVLNRYAHGFVVVPVVLACRRGGVLAALRETPRSAEELSTHLRANSGHLGVSLRVFESLGWIERDADGRLSVTADALQEKYISDDLWPLVDVDFDSYLRSGPGGLITHWCNAVRTRWNCPDPLFADFLDGMLVVPLLALLAKRGVLHELLMHDFNQLPAAVRPEAIELLRILGWLEGAQGQFRLTGPGSFMFERAMNLAVAESYRPMLRAMDRLLFGDAAGVFDLDSDGRETHVDRSMNVLSSGFMHDRYFAEVEDILVSIFSREPFSSQPRYVADMGCGDGTFLRRVLTTVRDKTPRGRVLAQHPLTLIGVDLNKASLEETSRKLQDLDHIMVTGDIGDPVRLVQDLRALGVDPDDVLHIRSFLDHDRPFIAPVDKKALQARAGAGYLGVYTDRNGKAIEPATIVQGLVEHLQRWAQAINKHGIILLEVHCQDPHVVHSNIDQSESLYFDAVEGYSQQLLVEADASVLAAAEAGLFPNPAYFKKFPNHLPATRITLNLFERQNFSIRLARTDDLPALLRLEEACWPERMRVAATELEQRIARYPLGQWVIELRGEVLGVIYSQRITDIDRLRTIKFKNLASLHDEHGGIVQLLGLNVLPESRHLGLGDRLLDLMLMRSSLQGGVKQVAGITRCLDFRGDSLDGLKNYVQARDTVGHPKDPILQFHHGHGAEFLDLVVGFRPEDTDNLGAGVLLRYDLVTPGLASATGSDSRSEVPVSTGPANTSTRLETCLRTLLGRRREAGFSWSLPLRDMGLDSLDLLGFRTQLQQIFERPLSPTFFFSYPTLRDIQAFFDKSPAAPIAAAAVDLKQARIEVAEPEPEPKVAKQPTPAPVAQARAAIAVVGMAGRFPGGNNLEDYWNVLAQARDAVTEIPAERWNVDAYFSADPAARGKIVSRDGGFLQHVDEFEPAFFNISPREAQSMDPQQRLLLEIHWEALEHAGIDPQKLRESACGVFVGLSARDYELLQAEAGGVEDLDIYHATGNSAAIAAGRLAYFLGTRGPALTLDTACSSSLVAVHQAINSLRSGESDLAIASGVNLILSPRPSIAFSQAGMLSPNGRCRTFDAGADGYVRAEGCGAVVLKRLDEAERDGDTILAVLRGSAINQDGASNGLTAPSLPAQRELLRHALKDADLQPADIDYVEAHGTGTSLGDPVEFDALRDVFGADAKRSAPLWIGSVKTNIGHAEAASGIAGLIKVVLSISRNWLPAHLNFVTPNSHIDLDSIPARIPVVGAVWNRDGRPLRAGVSSFGFSGTNSHVIIEQAAVPAQRSSSNDRPSHVLALSAKSAPALHELVQDYGSWISDHPQTDLGDLCRAASVGRAHHDHRLALVASSLKELRSSLSDLGSREIRPRRMTAAPKIAYLFTGQGSQYPGMARELWNRQPAFRAALRECSDLLRAELGQPIEDLLFSSGASSAVLDDTAYTQPLLFAVEYSLARMLEAWGVQPSVVMGHSVGEYVAACIAGIFSLSDGLKLITARGRLMSALPRDGAMLSVMGGKDIIDRALKDAAAEIGVAAYNGPDNRVLSGKRSTIKLLEQKLTAAGVRNVPLQVSHAFHSPLMQPVLDPFRKIAAEVKFSAAKIEFVSNLYGRPVKDEILGADYWCRHILEPVRFEQGVTQLLAGGADALLELGPHPVLTALARNFISGPQTDHLQWLHTLQRGASDWDGLVAAVAALYESGVSVAWSEVDAGFMRRRVDVPGYPWQRRRFWFESTGAQSPTRRAAPASGTVPYDGVRLQMPNLRGTIHQFALTASSAGFLADHRVFGSIVVPGPVLIDMALAAAAQPVAAATAEIQNLVVHQAITVPDQGIRMVHLSLAPPVGTSSAFEIYAADDAHGENPVWTLRATGSVTLQAGVTSPAPGVLDPITARCTTQITPDQFYGAFETRGVTLGQSTRAVHQLVRGEHETLADLRLPQTAGDPGNQQQRPILLDAALQLIAYCGIAPPDSDDGTDLNMFCGFESLQFFGPIDGDLVCHATRESGSDSADASFRGSARLYSKDGTLVARLAGVRFRRATRGAVLDHEDSAAKLLFDLDWQPRNSLAHALARQAPDYLTPVAELGRDLQSQLSRLPILPAGADRDAAAAFDELAAHYAAQAFRSLGWQPEVGAAFSPAELIGRLGILANHVPLAGRMLEILAQDGTLDHGASGWTVARPLPVAAATLARSVAERFPTHAAELLLLERCAGRLAEVLTGQCDPLQLLFPDGSLESAARLYDDSAMARVPNTLMRSLMAAVTASVPGGRVLRVLELGAGTGGTTKHLMPLLQSGTCEYVFSDVSKAFLQRAEQRFRGHPALRFALLDIEQPAAGQGLAAGQFDLILAANVLHATQDLEATLVHARQLLAPGGLLALIEGTVPAAWIDLVFGQTGGWWRFTDHDLRPVHPLISVDKWTGVLQTAGFTDVCTQPAFDERHPSIFKQALIIAKNGPATPVASIARTATADRCSWLIFGDTSALCAELTERLEAGGNRVIRVLAQSGDIRRGADVWPVNPADADSVAQAVAQALAGTTMPCRYAVCLWGASLTTAPSDAAEYDSMLTSACAALHAAQALVRDTAITTPPLWMVTRGTQAAGGTQPDPRGAPVWGLARVLRVEHPKSYGGLIDLDVSGAWGADVDAIVSQVVSPDDVDECAFRGGVRFVPTLLPSPKTIPLTHDWQTGCYLITGGLGGVGLHIAHWMAQQGARRIVLMSRRTLPARDEWDRIDSSDASSEAVAGIREIERLGATVLPVAIDIADRSAMMRVIGNLAAQAWGPVRGVVHAAAAIEDRLLADLNGEAISASFKAKVRGALNLESCLADQPLEFLVYCSSVTSLLGQVGQASYSAANASLDALAGRRRAQGRPAVSILWGGWQGAGMARSGGGLRSIQGLERLGLWGFTPEQGNAALGQLIGRDAALAVVTRIDWTGLGQETALPLLLRRLAAEAPAAADDPAVPEPATAATNMRRKLLARPPGGERSAELERQLRELLAGVLRLDPAAIDSQTTLGSLGLDSLMAVEFKNRCERSFELKLSATMVWNYPTISALAGHISDKLGFDPAVNAAAALGRTQANTPSTDDARTSEMMRDVSDLSEEAALQALLGATDS